MPFKSEKQRRYMFKNRPDVAKKWEAEGKAYVAKSYVPGKGYVKAAEAGSHALREARIARKMEAYDRQLGNDPSTKESQRFHTQATETRKLINEHSKKSFTAPSGAVHHGPKKMLGAQMGMSGTRGFMVRTGSKSNGQSHVFLRPNTSRATVNHEMTHAAPKRSSYRMDQIVSDPMRLAREEARAEMGANASHAYYKNPIQSSKDKKAASGYSMSARDEKYREAMRTQTAGQPMEQMFTKEGMDEFRGTQDKIAAARRSRGVAEGREHEAPNTPYNRKNITTHWDRQRGKYLKGGAAAAVVGLHANENPKPYQRAFRGAKFRGNQYMTRNGQRVNKSLDYGYTVSKAEEPEVTTSNEQNEELQNVHSSLVLDMGQSIANLRVRDRSTGKFVPGSASLLASQFKRDADVRSEQ